MTSLDLCFEGTLDFLFPRFAVLLDKPGHGKWPGPPSCRKADQTFLFPFLGVADEFASLFQAILPRFRVWRAFSLFQIFFRSSIPGSLIRPVFTLAFSFFPCLANLHGLKVAHLHGTVLLPFFFFFVAPPECLWSSFPFWLVCMEIVLS